MKLSDMYFIGSHNSAAFSISFRNKAMLQFPFNYLGHFPYVIKPFTQTQRFSIISQLRIGIRFLDLRISKFEQTLFCSHTYLCMSLEEVVNEIAAFIKLNPKELILIRWKIDFNFKTSVSKEEVLSIFSNGNTFSLVCYHEGIWNVKVEDLLSHGNIILLDDSHIREVWLNTITINEFHLKYSQIPSFSHGNVFLSVVLTHSVRSILEILIVIPLYQFSLHIFFLLCFGSDEPNLSVLYIQTLTILYIANISISHLSVEGQARNLNDYFYENVWKNQEFPTFKIFTFDFVDRDLVKKLEEHLVSRI